MENSSHYTGEELHDRLTAALLRLRRRLRLRDGIYLLMRRGWLIALIVVAIQAVTWVVPIERAHLWSAGVMVAAGAGWLAWVALRPLSLAATARRLDAEGRFKERLATALELSSDAGARLPAARELVVRQLHDAVTVAERAAQAPAATLRITYPRRRLALAGALLVAAFTLALLPNPQRHVVAERQAVRALAQEEAERIEQVRRTLEQRETLPREERERLLQELDALAARLRENPGDRERALADIERAREVLRDRLDPAAGTRRASLEELSRQLSALSGQTEEQSSLTAGAEALRDLAGRTAQLSPQERAETAAALREQAGRVAATDPTLAQALTDLADALEAGETEAAEAAAVDGEQALRAAAGELSDQQAVAQALDTLEESRQALAQAGGDGATNAQGENAGAGQGQDVRSGEGGQQAGAGGGTQSDQLPPDTREGRFGGSDPDEAGAGAQTGEYDPSVFAPVPPGGSTDRDVLPGQQGDDGTTVERERRDPGAGLGGDAVVPLRDVLPAYRDAAGRALEQEYVPAGMKDYVREYFTRLSE